MKSLVIGQPVLLALEEIDGTPSFLEKALKFLEEHGKVSYHFDVLNLLNMYLCTLFFFFF